MSVHQWRGVFRCDWWWWQFLSPSPAAPHSRNKSLWRQQLSRRSLRTLIATAPLILIRTTLIALDQANKSGNYSVLRALCAPDFQANNSPERLAEIFARQRAQGLDLAGVVAIDPQLTLLPQIEPNGMLHLAGFFPSFPAQVYFELCSLRLKGSGNLSVFQWTCALPPRRRQSSRAPRRSRS